MVRRPPRQKHTVPNKKTVAQIAALTPLHTLGPNCSGETVGRFDRDEFGWIPPIEVLPSGLGPTVEQENTFILSVLLVLAQKAPK